MEHDPIVLWLSGKPDSGKTTTATIISHIGLNISLTKTDDFVMSLPSWCPDETIREGARKAGKHAIGRYLDGLAKSGQADLLADLFLNDSHGFTLQPGLNIIEGYMPIDIQDRIMDRLKHLGAKVWIAMTQPQFDFIRRGRNWR